MKQDKTTTINGFNVSLTFEQNGNDTFSQVWLDRGDFGGCLETAISRGGLFNDCEDCLTIPNSVINVIERWAINNGY